MAGVQRIHLVCRPAPAAVPRGLRYCGPGGGEGTMLAELREPEPGESDARHRLETCVRSLAHDHPYQDLVLELAPEALRDLLAELTGTSPGAVSEAALRPGALTTVGLPRAPRTVGVGPVAILALVLAFVDNLLWGSFGRPFLATAAVVATGVLLCVPTRTRHWGFAIFKGAAAGALLTVLLLSSVNRFPDQ